MPGGTDMPAQSVDLGNIFTGSVFDRELEFRESQAAPHQSRVLIREFLWIRQGGVVRSNHKHSAIEAGAKILTCPQ